MKHIAICLFATLIAFTVFSTAVAVAEGNSVKLQVTVEAFQEETNVDGETVLKLVPAETVVPGEEVVYNIHYVNHGNESADNVVITNAVPAHLQFRGESSDFPQAVMRVSVDGGRSYHGPDNLWVFAPNGTKRRASVTDYTHIQWTLQESLLPGMEGIVGYRAQLK